jgi:hypothetical protein
LTALASLVHRPRPQPLPRSYGPQHTPKHLFFVITLVSPISLSRFYCPPRFPSPSIAPSCDGASSPSRPHAHRIPSRSPPPRADRCDRRTLSSKHPPKEAAAGAVSLVKPPPVQFCLDADLASAPPSPTRTSYTTCYYVFPGSLTTNFFAVIQHRAQCLPSARETKPLLTQLVARHPIVPWTRTWASTTEMAVTTVAALLVVETPEAEIPSGVTRSTTTAAPGVLFRLRPRDPQAPRHRFPYSHRAFAHRPRRRPCQVVLAHPSSSPSTAMPF